MRPIRGLLRKHTGAMTRLGGPLGQMLSVEMRKKKHHSRRFGPGIWSRLSPEHRARIDVCLVDAAERMHCRKNELLWSMDERGVLHIDKRNAICLTTKP